MNKYFKSAAAITFLGLSSLSFAQPSRQENKVVSPPSSLSAVQAEPTKPAYNRDYKHREDSKHKDGHNRRHEPRSPMDMEKMANHGLERLERQIEAGKKDGSLTPSELSLLSSKIQSLKSNVEQAKQNKTPTHSEVKFIRSQFRETFKTIHELRRNSDGKELKRFADKKEHYEHGKDKKRDRDSADKK